MNGQLLFSSMRVHPSFPFMPINPVGHRPNRSALALTGLRHRIYIAALIRSPSRFSQAHSKNRRDGTRQRTNGGTGLRRVDGGTRSAITLMAMYRENLNFEIALLVSLMLHVLSFGGWQYRGSC